MAGTRNDPRTPGGKQAGTDPKDSEAVRRALLAHVGMDPANFTAALAAVGWPATKKKPKWATDGNIPKDWRDKLWTYLGGRK
jgi:hypothetical protein